MTFCVNYSFILIFYQCNRLCNMGTVLVLHFILFMQHKNRPHIA